MLALILLIICSVESTKQFPSYIEKCHRSDPNAKLCYMNAVNTIKEHLNRGIPEFGLPPMSPLVLPEISLDSDGRFRAIFKNVKIFNLEALRIQNININLNENRFTIKFQIPSLRIASEYNIQGNILFLRLNSNGEADGNLTDVEAEISLQGRRYKKGNKEYLIFSSMEIKEKMHKPILRFGGLFKDNPELTQHTNRIVNENIEEIMDELRPAIHVAIEQTVLGLIRRLFEKYSVQELFPE